MYETQDDLGQVYGCQWGHDILNLFGSHTLDVEIETLIARSLEESNISLALRSMNWDRTTAGQYWQILTVLIDFLSLAECTYGLPINS